MFVNPHQRIADLEAEVERLDAVVAAAVDLVAAHRRLIFAVTPGHPKSLLKDRDQYEAVFSRWHDRTRNLRDALIAAGIDTGEHYS